MVNPDLKNYNEFSYLLVLSDVPFLEGREVNCLNLQHTTFSFSRANSIMEWDVWLENLSSFFFESQSPV